MVPDRAFLQRSLETLRHNLSLLEEYARLTRAEYLRDERSRLATERLLQLSAECMLDVLEHLLTCRHAEPCNSYEDVIDKARSLHLVSSTLGQSLAGLGRFRNVLVHAYLALDHGIVYRNLQKMVRMLPSFISEMEIHLSM